jgi:hypothetical protein
VEIEGALEWFPFTLSNDQETPCPERQEHDGRNGVVHRVTRKTLPTEAQCKVVFCMMARNLSPFTVGSSKNKGPINLL